MAKLGSLDKISKQNYIAKNVALLLKSGVVNLGIGVPTRVPEFLSGDIELILHSENGYVGMGKAPKDKFDILYNPHIISASGTPSSIVPGGAFFDSCTSFGLIRGGHLDTAVLGALEVDEEGNLANYTIPGKYVPGIGGAMDLVSGAKKVIIAMEHCTKDGISKILKKCTLPLTGKNCVDIVVTEMCVLELVNEGFKLIKLNKDITIDELIKQTDANIIVSDEYEEMAEL